jgi:hypothetical protein
MEQVPVSVQKEWQITKGKEAKNNKKDIKLKVFTKKLL